MPAEEREGYVNFVADTGETAMHAAYWKYCVRRRLLGEKRGGFSLKGSNFWVLPQERRTQKQIEQDWKEAVKLLEREHGWLRSAVGGGWPRRWRRCACCGVGVNRSTSPRSSP